jgi:hypothetical protein
MRKKYRCNEMNPQDATNQNDFDETLDDLDVLIISDAQCEEIEHTLVICKNIITGTISSGIVIFFYYFVVNYSHVISNCSKQFYISFQFFDL